MASMYEKIMNMPLFIGMSHQQISAFVEKTPVSFSQYEKNDVVCHIGDNVNSYMSMVEGELEIIHHIGTDNSFTLFESINRPFMLNADRMFGIKRVSDVEIRANKRTSVMEFSKEEFIKLLHSDNIILLNYLNNLCLKGQLSTTILNHYPDYGLEEFICQTLRCYTSKLSKQVEFKINPAKIAVYLNRKETEVIHYIDKLNAEDKLIRTTDGFIIKDRSLFI